jgi:hypothetical protein
MASARKCEASIAEGCSRHGHKLLGDGGLAAIPVIVPFGEMIGALGQPPEVNPSVAIGGVRKPVNQSLNSPNHRAGAGSGFWSERFRVAKGLQSMPA